MGDLEKLVALIKNAKAAMRGKEFTCNLEREYFMAEYMIDHGVKVKEMQKPLTVEEATGTLDIVWFEQKHLYAEYPCDAVIAPDCVNVNISMIGHSVPLVRAIKDYGKTWRCWAEKPTKAEWEAAEWLK